MRPEFNSRRLFGITRSKGKMYELGLPEAQHIAVPANTEPQALFLLTVATLGDFAATVSDSENVNVPLPPPTVDELNFSASFFDALLESRFAEEIDRDTTVLAASAYYLARRPGSSLVLARRLADVADDPAVDKLLRWILQAKWQTFPADTHPIFGTALGNVGRFLHFHFHDGSGLAELKSVACGTEASRLPGCISPRTSVHRHHHSHRANAGCRLGLDHPSRVYGRAHRALGKTRFAGPSSRRSFGHRKCCWPGASFLEPPALFKCQPAQARFAGEIVLRSGFLSGRTKLAVYCCTVQSALP